MKSHLYRFSLSMRPSNARMALASPVCTDAMASQAEAEDFWTRLLTPLKVLSSDEDQQEVHRKDVSAQVAKLVHDGEATLLKVVQQLGSCLTSDSSLTRMQGMLVLVEVIERTRELLSANELDHITVFFGDRLKDWHTLRATLKGCKVLLQESELNVCRLSKDNVNKIIKVFFDVDVQSHSQPNRQLSLELFELILSQHTDVLLGLDEDVLDVLMRFVDGEKDPRCLLLGFGCLEKTVEKLCSVHEKRQLVEDSAENVTDVLSCYFPLSFSPPPESTSKSVTRSELLEALFRAYSCSPFFFPHVIQLLRDRIPSPKSETKKEGLLLLKHCLQTCSKTVLYPLVDQVWNLISAEILFTDKSISQVEEVSNEIRSIACECIRILSAFTDSAEDLKVVNLLLKDDITKAALQECSVAPKDEETNKKYNQALSVLSVTAGASQLAFDKIIDATLPFILKNVSIRSKMTVDYLYRISSMVKNSINGDMTVEMLSSLRPYAQGMADALLQYIASSTLTSENEWLTSICIKTIANICCLPREWLSSDLLQKIVSILTTFILTMPESTNETCIVEAATAIISITTLESDQSHMDTTIQKITEKLSEGSKVSVPLICVTEFAKQNLERASSTIVNILGHVKALLKMETQKPKSNVTLLKVFDRLLVDTLPFLIENKKGSIKNAGVLVKTLCAFLAESVEANLQVDTLVSKLTRCISYSVLLCDKDKQSEFAKEAERLLTTEDGSPPQFWQDALPSQILPSSCYLIGSALLISLESLDSVCSIEDILHSLLEAVITSEDVALGSELSFSLLNLVCKLSRKQIDDLVMPLVSDVLLNHLTSCDDPVTFGIGFKCLTLIARAMAMKKYKHFDDIAEKIFELLVEEKVNRVDLTQSVGKASALLISNELDGTLQLLQCHGSFLWRQKCFTLLISRLIQHLSAASTLPLKFALQQLFSAFIANVPTTVLKLHIGITGTHIIDSINFLATAELPQSNALKSNLIILQDVICWKEAKTLFLDHAQGLIEGLVAACKCQGEGSQQIRNRSLDCISKLRALPHYSIYPYYHTVRRTLQALLDDPKRDVRSLAGKTLRIWTEHMS